jgi:FMN phosphatase YigB (HAD superfamily)
VDQQLFESQKLEALGLDRWFSFVLSAHDPEINVFKPHPRGFVRAAELWRLDPDQVLVVGDRVDVDGEGARAAGMDCVIVGRGGRGESLPARCLQIENFERLRDAVNHHSR